MHEAINRIRDLKSQIQSLHSRFEDDARLKPVLAAADELNRKLAPMEEELIQVNMKGSEANLAFPNMLNEYFDSFAASVESADAAPTQQQYEVYRMLNGRLEAQLARLEQVLGADLATFAALAKKHDVPILYLPKSK